MAKTILTQSSEKILTITLNRPARLNALSPTMLAEIKTALDGAAVDETISVVVIRAAGKTFCAGYDLNEADWITSQYPANYPQGVEIETDKRDIAALLDYWLEMRGFPKPIICQVQGACLSGAGELLAACDLVVASENAVFGHPAARDLGIPPTVFFWPYLLGMRKTKEMLFTAGNMSANEAEKRGLINAVAPEDELEKTTRALALDIAKTPVAHLIILKQAANNFYDNMGLEKSTRQASDLDAEFHQSPTFLAFFKRVKDKGMKAALARRAKLFG
jgi:enoyl-CoA hydratase